MSFVNMTCTKCGGSIEFDDCKEFGTCLYCGSKVYLNRPTSQPKPTYQPSQPRTTNRPPDYGRSNSNPYTNPYGGGSSGSNPYGNGNYSAPQTTTTRAQHKKRNNIIGIIIAIVIAIVVIVVVTQQIDSDHVTTKETRVMTASQFNAAAEKAGYVLIIDEDYDGFNTYWSGAHKFAPGTAQKEGNQVYVVDFTLDESIHNAKVEYKRFTDGPTNEEGKIAVKAIGGTAKSGSGKNYEYQINASSTMFGIAYRIDEMNLVVTASNQYRNEIIDFFTELGFGLDIERIGKT